MGRSNPPGQIIRRLSLASATWRWSTKKPLSERRDQDEGPDPVPVAEAIPGEFELVESSLNHSLVDIPDCHTRDNINLPAALCVQGIQVLSITKNIGLAPTGEDGTWDIGMDAVARASSCTAVLCSSEVERKIAQSLGPNKSSAVVQQMRSTSNGSFSISVRGRLGAK